MGQKKYPTRNKITSSGQGSSNLALEGQSPAEFSSNPDQTHLSKLIKDFRITRESQVGEFDQSLSLPLQGSGTPGR